MITCSPLHRRRGSEINVFQFHAIISNSLPYLAFYWHAIILLTYNLTI